MARIYLRGRTYWLDFTVRPLRGSTGRLLAWMIARNESIWPFDSSIGVRNTNQLTPSLQGGVVSDPL